MNNEIEQEVTGLCNLSEFLAAEIPPESADSAYRHGYSHGYARALQDLATAHKMGYSRAIHALDVLAKFWARSLYLWSVKRQEQGLHDEPPPKIKIERWHDIASKVFERDNYTCLYCGRSKEKDGVQLHCDHVDALANGGGNEFANLVTSCKECNRAKGRKPIEIFNWRAYLKWAGYDVE